MFVHYEDYRFNKTSRQVESVEEFSVSRLVDVEDNWGDRKRHALEKQVEEVAGAMGRLMDLLLTKGLMTSQEFLKVVGIDYNADKYEVKREDR